MVEGGGVKRTALKRRHPGSAAAAPGLRARLSRDFRHAVTAGRVCVVCGASGPLDAHHVVRVQTMKRHGLPPEVIYHPAAGIPACRTCHARHHAFIARIPRRKVPPGTVAFLAGHGLAVAFARDYPAEEKGAA